jgi:hypothetical protein
MKVKPWPIELVLVFIIGVMAWAFFRRQSPSFYRLSWNFSPSFVSSPKSTALTLEKLFVGKYENQRITVRGQVRPAPAVCQRQSCPPADSCCGCPPNIGLQMSGQYLLQLEASCRRQACRYDCGDWQKNKVYEVTGVLSVGWPNQYRLTVENKRLVSSRRGWLTTVVNFWQDFRSFLRGLTQKGDYLIQ